MNPDIPKMMQAVCLTKEEGQLSSKILPVPQPGKGEVLIKISASPINPSDLANIKRTTTLSERLSLIPGTEGCGTVVSNGRGLLPQLWSGKRVACSSTHATSGTWAEYMVTSASLCIPLPVEISDEQGSMLLVNPMTALAFIDIARHGRHKAIINTAAASSLGRIIEVLGSKHKIPIINIVRNEKQKSSLTNLGSPYVLDSSNINFEDDLNSLSHNLDASLIFDAIGGSFTRKLLMSVPCGSSIILYGNLSGEQPEINYRSMIMDDKTLSGFFLGNWLKKTASLKTIMNILKIRQLLKKEILIPVQDSFPLNKAQLAMETYLGNMTAGKVLLRPGLE